MGDTMVDVFTADVFTTRTSTPLPSPPICGCLQMERDRENLEMTRELAELRAGSVTFETSQDERNPKWDTPESESHLHQFPHPSILVAQALAIHQQFYEVYR